MRLARAFNISRETVYQYLRTDAGACPDASVEALQDASIAAPQIQT
ncbi:helix-turn-helix domain-containing protein [Thiocapsa imhoffii]